MIKIKMIFLIFQIDGILKNAIHRKSDYLEIKKILDDIRNKIIEARTGSLEN